MRPYLHLLFVVFQILVCEEQPGQQDSVPGNDNSKSNEDLRAGQHPGLNPQQHGYHPQPGQQHHPPSYQGAQMQGNFQIPQQAQMQGNFPNHQHPQMPMQGNFQNLQPSQMQGNFPNGQPIQGNFQNPQELPMQGNYQNHQQMQGNFQQFGMPMMPPNQGNFANQGNPNFGNPQLPQYHQNPGSGQYPNGQIQHHQGEHMQNLYPQHGVHGQEGFPQGQMPPNTQHSDAKSVGSLGQSDNPVVENIGEPATSEGNLKENSETSNIAKQEETQHGHGHSHQHVDHGHGHSHQHVNHGHGHSHQHDDHGHDHGHSHQHDDHGHGHSHQHDDHGHGHSHQHNDLEEHGHGHSHGHQGCNHGMGHLGKRGATTEKPPEHYKPASQDFDLPLSARFGGGGSSSFNYEYTTEASTTTENYQYSTDSSIYSSDNIQYVNQDLNPKIEDEGLQDNNVFAGVDYQAETVDHHSPVEEASLYDSAQPNNDVVDQANLVNDETLDQQQEVLLPPPPSDEVTQDWLQMLVAGGNLEFNQERLSLVTVVALTLVLIFFISGYLSSTASESPLLNRIDQMEKKLAVTVKEILQLQNESSANSFDINENNPELKENELKLESVRQELENSRELLRTQEMTTKSYLAQFESKKQELEAVKRETRQAEEMMEELIAEQKNTNSNKDMLSAIKQLQVQFEQQKATLKKYEPRLKKKEKENKELSLTMRQLKADAANATLETDKLKKELNNLMQQKQEASSKVENISKNDDEWKSLANLLQKQLDDKCEEIFEKENSSVELKQRLSDIEKKSESNDEQMEILEEVIKEMRKKHLVVEEKDGWEVEGDGWNDTNEDLTDLEELKSRNGDLLSQKDILSNKLQEIKSELEVSNSLLSKHKEDCVGMRNERDEMVKNFTATQNKLEVLTEFFNKKEAELQKQIGLQSAKFGDVSSDAENTSRRLEVVNAELEAGREELRSARKELEEQERSLKSNVSEQEKVAHECWVHCRQAERKVTELQTESSVLRSRLTIAESKNNGLEREKAELESAIKSLQGSVKSESGLESSASLGSLPPLPGLPGLPGGMMMVPGLASMRPPPLGEMSPRSRSPSPREYRREYRERRDSSGDRYSVRSDRSARYRHGPSPRSERGYRV